MVEFKQRKNLASIELLDLYGLFSFISSLVLLTGLKLYSGLSLLDLPFASMLVVGNYLFFIHSVGQTNLIKESIEYSGFFLFQILMLMGLSFQHQLISGIFLCFIPLLTGLYFFLYKDVRTERSFRIKAQSLFIILGSSYFFFAGFFHYHLILSKEGIAMVTFSLWSLGIIYWGSQYIAKEQRSFLFSLLKRKKEDDKSLDKTQRERFFFHDIVNQTHGMNLFLNYRLSARRGLTFEESMALSQEMKTLQSLIKDHYGLGHKDLLGTYEFVSFSFALKSIKSVIDTYLPDTYVQKHYVLKGHLNFDNNEEETPCLVHYPLFHRVINNLVKNMAEDKATEVEFIFNYDDEGLSMIFKNKLFRLKDEQGDLGQKLGHIILDPRNSEKIKDRESGVGLESICGLCEEVGGSFKFHVVDDYWVNEVFLPAPSIEQKKISNLKKTA